jgi:glycosyltransferase involved in cell wall biosynthesis
MRVVHCLGWYFPEQAGGTESYVRSLARAQRAQGADVMVFAPRDGLDEARYEVDGVPVFRYPVPEERTRAQHRGELPHPGFDRFERALRGARPDVFHLHSVTYGCNVHHLRAAAELGARTLSTLHVPGVVCARDTLMLHGRQACDGRIDVDRCVPCWLQSRGMRERTAAALGGALAAGRTLARTPLPGRVGTLLETPARIERKASTLHELARTASRLVVVCDWLGEVLGTNGVDPARVVRMRQAVDRIPPHGERGVRPRADGTLRVAYFGRAHRVKGIDTLIDAVRGLPAELPVALSVHALTGSDEERIELDGLRRRAAGERRITFEDPVASRSVMDAMREHDVIAVPSRWLETGPMVVLQALAAGVPVLGSDLGGLRELVAPGATGWLEPTDDVPRWTTRLRSLCEPGAARLSFEAPVELLHTWDALASRTLDLYRELS